MPHLDEGALWVRATTPYTISFEEASRLSPQIRDILLSFPQVTTVANELGRPGRRHRSHRLLQQRILRGAEALFGPVLEGRDPHQAATDRGSAEEAGVVSGHHLQLHAARRRRGGRGGDRAEERAGGEDFRPGPGDAGREGVPGEEHSRRRSRASGRSPWCGNWASPA